MTFTDTHCHIHDSEFYTEDREQIYERALAAGIERVICVGTDLRSSQEAVVFVAEHSQAHAVVGVHPHETKHWPQTRDGIRTLLETGVAGIGEIGLDYFYNHSPRSAQIAALEEQLQWSLDYNLPVSFHVREAFDDFWPVFDHFKGLRGVLHSYTDSLSNMDKALSRGLLIGVNGIATFAPDRSEVYRAIPLSNLLLETDAPFLTPKPLRGKVNEPAFVTHVAQYIANLQSIPLEELSRVTEQNATQLFNI